MCLNTDGPALMAQCRMKMHFSATRVPGGRGTFRVDRGINVAEGFQPSVFRSKPTQPATKDRMTGSPRCDHFVVAHR